MTNIQNDRTDHATVRRLLQQTSAAAGRAALDAVITQQAQIIAYIDDYKLLMIATIAVLPLLVVFKKASSAGAPDHSVVME
jgi:MFS transporter, DHA2 family, multidrug resistance protein